MSCLSWCHTTLAYLCYTVLIYGQQRWFHYLQLAGSAGCDPWGQRYCWTHATVSGTVKRAMCSCAAPLSHTHTCTPCCHTVCHSTRQSFRVLPSQYEHILVRGCRRKSIASSCVSISVSHILKLSHAVQCAYVPRATSCMYMYAGFIELDRGYNTPKCII